MSAPAIYCVAYHNARADRVSDCSNGFDASKCHWYQHPRWYLFGTGNVEQPGVRGRAVPSRRWCVPVFVVAMPMLAPIKQGSSVFHYSTFALLLSGSPAYARRLFRCVLHHIFYMGIRSRAVSCGHGAGMFMAGRDFFRLNKALLHPPPSPPRTQRLRPCRRSTWLACALASSERPLTLPCSSSSPARRVGDCPTACGGSAQ